MEDPASWALIGGTAVAVVVVLALQWLSMSDL